jgi:hypothetical protein
MNRSSVPREASRSRCEHLVRIVVDHHADVERVRVVDDADLRVFGRCRALDRFLLREVADRGRRKPHGLVESAVELDLEVRARSMGFERDRRCGAGQAPGYLSRLLTVRDLSSRYEHKDEAQPEGVGYRAIQKTGPPRAGQAWTKERHRCFR